MKKIISTFLQLLVVNFLLAQITVPKVIVEKTNDLTLKIPDEKTGKIKLSNGQLQLDNYLNNNHNEDNPVSFLTLDEAGNVTQHNFSAWEDLLSEIDSLKNELSRLDSLEAKDNTPTNEEICVTASGDLMTAIQDIPTIGALDWEVFEDNEKKYALVANYYNSSSYNVNSTLYSINELNGNLTEIQSIPTNGAREWEIFSEGEKTYALVANYYNNSSYNNNSKLYSFDTSSEKFIAIQDIATNGSTDWEVFNISGKTYALVANAYTGNSHNTNSKLYSFDTSSEKFIAIQDIPTTGNFDWEIYTVNNKTYALSANNLNGTIRNLNSKVYEFDEQAGRLTVIQDIPTNGAYDWEIFEVNNKHYALVANYYNGTTRNINSRLYQIDPLSRQTYGDPRYSYNWSCGLGNTQHQ